MIAPLSPRKRCHHAHNFLRLPHALASGQTYGKKGWNTDYRKELSIEKFCGHARPQLQAEDELGFELWLFAGGEKSPSPLKQKPYITLNLHTFKLNHVVATATDPASAGAISLSYRLSPRGKSLVEISCWKK